MEFIAVALLETEVIAEGFACIRQFIDNFYILCYNTQI